MKGPLFEPILRQASCLIPRLKPEVVEEIFARALSIGQPKLDFEYFEKAVIMASLLYFPSSHAGSAYTQFVDSVLLLTPSLVSAQVPPVPFEKLSDVADILLEKRFASTMNPLFGSDIPTSDSRSIRRSKSAELLQERKSNTLEKSTSPMTSIDFDRLVKEINQKNRMRRPPYEARAAVPPDPIELDSAPQTASEPVGSSHKPLPDTFVLLPARPQMDNEVKTDDELGRIPPDVEPARLPATQPGFPPRPTKIPAVAPEMVHQTDTPEPSARIEVSPKLEQAIELQLQTKAFVDSLIRTFGSLDLAFGYIDGASGRKTGKVSMTKFLYGIRHMALNRDPKDVFYHIDVKGDGALDLEELRTWEGVREENLNLLRRFHIDHNILKSAN